MQDGWSPLRPSRSEHYINGIGSGLSSAIRIHPLVESANAYHITSPYSVGSNQDLTPSIAPPAYESIYGSRERKPPAYNQVPNLRPSFSSWMVSSELQKPRMIQPTWAKESRPLELDPSSPAGYFQAMERENLRERSRNRDMAVKIHQSTPITVTSRVSLNSAKSNQSRNGYSEFNPSASSSSITPRNAQRQASFIAAVGRHPLREAVTNGNLRSNETRSAPASSRQKSSSSESTTNTSSNSGGVDVSPEWPISDRTYNRNSYLQEQNGNGNPPAMDFFFYEDYDLQDSPKPPYKRPSSPYRQAEFKKFNNFDFLNSGEKCV
ncbi:hypothetical protein WR25_10757 [Diploscapter pachys]|uniref:Uncharacterized protein n=1 Tax=Diploscapter pachys TaxID=2018661 RepID=A0A2A2JBN8_9BILA|nr:hypothetical protein WR25_10757 [Diploscapter pachys]